MRRRRLVRAPASSANLGPGFDTLAAALALHLELEVEETGRVRGRDRPRRRRATGRNLVVRAFETLHPADGFTFRIALRRSRSPAGWGRARRRPSPGLMAADHIFELDADLLAAATELEGHPDNAAAVAARRLRGVRRRRGRALRRPRRARGRRSSCRRGRCARRRRAPRCPPRSRWRTPCSTSAHASLLVLGLAKGEWDLVARGLHDRLHQPRRAHLYPRIAEPGRARARARRARRDDLRRRPGRALLDATTSRRAESSRPAPRRARRRGPPRAVRAAGRGGASCRRSAARAFEVQAPCRSLERPPRCALAGARRAAEPSRGCTPASPAGRGARAGA